MGFSETSCIPKLTGAATVHPPSRPRVLRDMAWRNNITESFSVRIFFRPESVWKSWNSWFFLGVLIGLQELFNIETNWFLVVGWHSYTAVAGIICKPLNPAALRSKWKFLSLFWRGKQLPPPFWSNQVSDMHHLSDTPFRSFVSFWSSSIITILIYIEQPHMEIHTCSRPYISLRPSGTS